MRNPEYPVKSLGNFIDGEFAIPRQVSGEWICKSPANEADIVGPIKYSYGDVERALASAKTAFPAWRKLPLQKRAEYLKKYQESLLAREPALVEMISRETGKPLWESKTELKAMIGKIDITINDSMKLVEDQLFKQIMPGADGAQRFRPLGVAAVIGPFNFPGHLPNGHIVPALLTGNTVVFKPSEKTPFTAQIMAECFASAGFPKGVFNLLQGEKEVGRRLCVHESVDAVLFTGSYEVGTRIKQDTLQQHWKLLALEMGGKNAAIVWSDADFEVALRETLVGSYLTTGQRCSCTSRIIVHKDLVDRFVQNFHERSKAFEIGHPFKDPFFGPLIDRGSVDRHVRFTGIAEREGGELVMRGKALKLDYEGHYVTPTICRFSNSSVETAMKSVYQQTELFSPSVAILETDDIEHAIALANATQYGLVASVFTSDRAAYDKFWDGLSAGVINWNRGTTGASSKLPFGGLKKSGNHFPTALPSTRYCTYPVASLESDKPEGGGGTYPGLNWEAPR